MKVLIGGGTGLIGQSLKKRLKNNGHEVYVLSRSAHDDDVIRWDIQDRSIEEDHIFDAVVNLTGAGIVDRKWTPSYKKTIINSRVNSIDTLDRYFQRLDYAPKFFINASAVGIYGEGGTYEFKEEDNARRKDFLVEVCEKWEAAVHGMITQPEQTFILRIGLVLSKDGGAFPKLSQGKMVGIVPHLGNGQQMISWIAMEDLVAMMVYLLENDIPSGTYNAVAPTPVSNKALSTIIAEKSGLGWSPPVPSFMVKALLGKRHIAVLSSTSVSSDKIQSTGFQFKYPMVEPVIENLLA